VLDQLQRAGVDYDDVTQCLEEGGVATFDSAWERLSGQLAATLRAQSLRQQRS